MCRGFFPDLKSKATPRKNSLSEKSLFFLKYHLHICLRICSGQIYFISYSTLRQAWSFCSNFKVIFSYTSKTKPHLWSVPSFKLNSWTVKKALVGHTNFKKTFIFLFQLRLNPDKYTVFLHFPFTRHKYTGEGAVPFCAVPQSSACTSGHICPALLTKQQTIWYLTYDPATPETTGGLLPPRNGQQTWDCKELSQSLIFQDTQHHTAHPSQPPAYEAVSIQHL